MLWLAVSPDAAFADKSTPTGSSVWRYLEYGLSFGGSVWRYLDSGLGFGGSGLVREEVCIL